MWCYASIVLLEIVGDNISLGDSFIAVFYLERDVALGDFCETFLMDGVWGCVIFLWWFAFKSIQVHLNIDWALTSFGLYLSSSDIAILPVKQAA